jgi:replicative DNA helicase
MSSNTRHTRGESRHDGQSYAERLDDMQAGMEKMLPQNVEAEAGVLGSLLIDPEAISEVADFLKPEMFYREAHRATYQAIQDLYEAGEPADLITLTDELARRGKLDTIGGISYVSSLANQVPTSANVVYYARIVERTYYLRRIIWAAGQMAAVAYNEPDAWAALDAAEQLLFDIRRTFSGDRTLMTMPEGLSDAMERLDALIEGRQELTGIPTGLRELDRMTSGLQKSDLIILGARPAVGKSSLMLTMASNAAIRHGFRILIFSLEMGKEQLVDRLLSMEAGVDLQKIRTGRYLSDDDMARISDACGRLNDAHVYIDDTPAITLMDMRAKARRAALEYGVDAIFVDYLQLMRGARPDGKAAENRVQEVSEISRGLKQLARDLRVPVLALSQVSRAVEARSDKHPILSDLRDSGTIEQDCDVCMFLYRDEVYNPDTDRQHIADLDVAKHRNGPIGRVNLYFHPAETRYRDLELVHATPAGQALPTNDDERWWQRGEEV